MSTERMPLKKPTDDPTHPTDAPQETWDNEGGAQPATQQQTPPDNPIVLATEMGELD